MASPEQNLVNTSRRGAALLALVGVISTGLLALLFFLIILPEPAHAEGGRRSADAVVYQAPQNLRLTKTASTPQPFENEVFKYNIILSNEGSTPIENVTVIDTPASGIVIHSGQPPAGTEYKHLDRSWNVPRIEPNSSLTLTLTAHIEEGSAGKSVSNTAAISGTTITSSVAVIPLPKPSSDADVGVSVSTSKSTAEPGEEISFTITVSNHSNVGATGAEITATLPANLVYISQSNSANITPVPKGNALTWTLSNPLLKDKPLTITIVGRVKNSAKNGDKVEVTVTTCCTNDLSIQDVSAVTTVQQQATANLEVRKEVNTSNPHELEQIVYTVTLDNNGPDPVTQFTISDTLPAGLTFVDWDASVGSFNNQTHFWSATNVNLANGEEATLTITATVNPLPDVNPTLQIENTAVLSNSVPADTSPDNNDASVTINVQQATIVEVEVLDGSGDPVVDATVVLTDSANTPFTAFTDDDGLAVLSSTSSKSMAAGPADIEVSKPGFYLAEGFPNAVKVQPGVVNPADAPYTVVLDRTTALQVGKTDNATSISRGATVDYRITIENRGTITATNIRITDTFPSQLTFSSFITNTISGNPPGLNLRLENNFSTSSRRVWTMIGGLGPNRRYEFIARFTVANDASGNITNSVDVHTTSPEANRSNNRASDLSNVGQTTATVTVSKSASPQEVRPGQNITFRIDIRNETNGPITINSITDNVPAHFQNISASFGPASNVGNVDPSVSQNSRVVSVPRFTLDAGDDAVLVISARVISTVSSTTTGTNSVTVAVQGSTNRTASATYRIVAQGTLPGTGFGPPAALAQSHLSSDGFDSPHKAGPHPRIEMRAQAGAAAAQAANGRGRGAAALAFVAALLLGAVGAAGLVYGLHSRGKSLEWGPYASRMGIAFIGLALVFALAGFWLSGYQGRTPTQAQADPAEQEAEAPLALATVEVWLPPSVPEEDLPSLPDYPVPTPQITPTAGEPTPDISPVVRISIPSIGVNHEVRYVPFDGYTWAISGLRHEVAWLGETSWPGLGGNTALAGHVNLRGGDNGPFRYLEDLIEGDVVRLYTEQNVYEYRVNSRRVVSETDTSVIQSGSTPQLTLITCTGWDPEVEYYLQRTVVFADLVQVTPRNREVSSIP